MLDDIELFSSVILDNSIAGRVVSDEKDRDDGSRLSRLDVSVADSRISGGVRGGVKGRIGN
jgi:hypothetical protein